MNQPDPGDTRPHQRRTERTMPDRPEAVPTPRAVWRFVVDRMVDRLDADNPPDRLAVRVAVCKVYDGAYTGTSEYPVAVAAARNAGDVLYATQPQGGTGETNPEGDPGDTGDPANEPPVSWRELAADAGTLVSVGATHPRGGCYTGQLVRLPADPDFTDAGSGIPTGAAYGGEVDVVNLSEAGGVVGDHLLTVPAGPYLASLWRVQANGRPIYAIWARQLGPCVPEEP